MDKTILIENVKRVCLAAGIKPTVAFEAAGIGKNFLSNIQAGKTPSVAKVADLAAYLGVSTSELVGDVRKLPPQLMQAWSQLNDEGREKLTDYAEDLAASGRYIKNRPSELENPTSEMKDA